MRIEGVLLLHILYVALAMAGTGLGYRLSRWFARNGLERGEKPGFAYQARLWFAMIFLSPAILSIAFGWYGAGEIRGICFTALFALTLPTAIALHFGRRRGKELPPAIPNHWKRKRTPGKPAGNKRKRRLSIGSIEGRPGGRSDNS
ncbi:hypothetical protein [Sphingomonas colocasiae]|uniref:Uncharacterized protein n=1 Tax=Sphingomonas colocasiae TaxID=1848973 RepID=A0ABS7PLL1_9SPHN|nr:hypothetical protein [Sphingomonas colocasiae]MBY8821869.1 hypothetical protein [Sphingomonas colocasiae]